MVSTSLQDLAVSAFRAALSVDGKPIVMDGTARTALVEEGQRATNLDAKAGIVVQIEYPNFQIEPEFSVLQGKLIQYGGQTFRIYKQPSWQLGILTVYGMLRA